MFLCIIGIFYVFYVLCIKNRHYFIAMQYIKHLGLGVDFPAKISLYVVYTFTLILNYSYMIPVIHPTPTSETFNMPVSSHLDSAVWEGAFGFLI